MYALSTPVEIAFDHGVDYGSVPERRPIFEVEFAAVDGLGRLLGSARMGALLDSGADMTVLDNRLAPLLGVDLSRWMAGTMEGVGGSVVAYYGELLVLIAGQWLPIPASFTAGRDLPLLGRAGIFDALHIAFVHSQAAVLAATA